MAIKVNIPAGVANVTVAGLYQWDYGQVLEIECAEIGSETLEVHFACHNMSEAIVRTCTFTVGVGTVTIPDECLEQASLVTAWLCRRDSTQRHTIKTITLPLTARTRPGNMLDDIPPSRADAVGQLIEEINEAIDGIENGTVTAAKAKIAESATHSTTAGSATSATYATSAGSANTATRANDAIYVLGTGLGSVTIDTEGKATISSVSAGTYLVVITRPYYDSIYNGITNEYTSGILYIGQSLTACSTSLGEYIISCRYNSEKTNELLITLSGTWNNQLTGRGATLKFYKIKSGTI